MLRQATTIVLGPVLMAQGRHVRRVTPVLPEPPGPREGVAGEGPDLRLLIVGDSAAAGVGAQSQATGLAGQIVRCLAPTRRLTWNLVARTGASTAGTLRHLRQLPATSFDVAVTSLGVNDVTAGLATEVWLRLQADLVALLRDRFGVWHTLLTPVPPMGHFPALPQPLRWYLGARSRSYNLALGDWADEVSGCELVPITYQPDRALVAADGYHPSPQLYAIWGAAVARRIEALGLHSPN